MDGEIFLTSSSSLFDTYLVYGIIGLLILIAIIGLIVLLATSCCCCFCCLSPASFRGNCCYSHNRHSSYKLTQTQQLSNDDSNTISFIRRQSSDVADFAQLYDSCPHLINNKATTARGTTMDSSCTTIDTVVSPISACSSFRSFAESGASLKDITSSTIPNDVNHRTQYHHTSTEKTNNNRLSAVKDVFSRPFSYIKNTADRTQIQRRFTPNERSSSSTSIPIDIKRMSPLENGNTKSTNITNIYDTVVQTAQSNCTRISTIEQSTPIYETEWTHNIRQLMMATSSDENENAAAVDVSSAPPDIISSTKRSSDYFQQENPYGKFLSNRTLTTESTRRTNMLNGLKDDSAFLY